MRRNFFMTLFLVIILQVVLSGYVYADSNLVSQDSVPVAVTVKIPDEFKTYSITWVPGGGLRQASNVGLILSRGLEKAIFQLFDTPKSSELSQEVIVISPEISDFQYKIIKPGLFEYSKPFVFWVRYSVNLYFYDSLGNLLFEETINSRELSAERDIPSIEKEIETSFVDAVVTRLASSDKLHKLMSAGKRPTISALMKDKMYAEVASLYEKKLKTMEREAKLFSNFFGKDIDWGKLVYVYYLMGRYDDVLETLDKLELYKYKGKTSRGWLGVTVQDLTPTLAKQFNMQMGKGVLVTGVETNGPADKAGIQTGDVITAVDKVTVTDTKSFIDIVAAKTPDSKILLLVKRGVKTLFIAGTTGEKSVEAPGDTEQAYSLEPAKALALFYRSFIHRYQGNTIEALRDAEQAYSLDSVNKWARLALGAARLGQSRYDEAIGLLSKVKDNTQARILEATAYAKKGDYQKAIDIYTSIEEELSPKDVPFWSDRNALLRELKPYIISKRENALRLKAQGRHKEALQELGELMKVADTGELESICREIAGIMAMDPGLSAIPEEARKYTLRGDVMTEEGKFDEAVKEYLRAVEAAPYIAKLHFNTAMIYGELKKYPQAIRYMKTYLMLAPEAPNARAVKDQIYKWEFMMEKRE